MEERAGVVISTKNWHYRLMKYVLGRYAPEPRNMSNLCPYFWLLVFTLLVSVIVVPTKAFFGLMSWLADSLDKLMIVPIQEKRADIWWENLNDFDVYMMWRNNEMMRKFLKNRFRNEEDVVEKWLKEKRGITIFQAEGYRNRTAAFIVWERTQEEEYQKIEQISLEKRKEERAKKREFKQNMESFRDGVDNIFTKVGDTIMSWNNIIKWTKRVVGLLITILLLVATYFVVFWLGKLILLGVINIKFILTLIFILGAIAAGVGIIYGFLYLIGILAEYVKENGSVGIWWVAMIYYPVYYIVYMPFKIVFYYILWLAIAVNTWYLLKAAALGLVKGFMNFLGIFGEYFGSSYTDYCPHLEWKEEEEK